MRRECPERPMDDPHVRPAVQCPPRAAPKACELSPEKLQLVKVASREWRRAHSVGRSPSRPTPRCMPPDGPAPTLSRISTPDATQLSVTSRRLTY